MSELKAIHAYTFDEVEVISTHSNGNDYYLKSEADKLIAELNIRICEGDEDFEIENNQIKRLLEIVRHQKYKRCLALSKLCRSEWAAAIFIPEKCLGEKHAERYMRWEKRWLKIAEQFKEAKCR